MPIPRRAWLAAFFEFFEGGLELRNQKFAVIRDVGDGGLPILDGVRLVAESGVAASQSQIGPKLFFRMALLVELKDLESTLIARCTQEAGAVDIHVEHAR